MAKEPQAPSLNFLSDWSEARTENLSEWLLLPFQSHQNDRLVELITL